ncbi:bacteriohopanetetrol glucosamine biosynthesis glycosyltransferase HpnI [Sabulicella rubraurantiaca]|uniref:bacteriohopanetetrol glucosamine biosynthesis glycosyltransferase HpnI n=1 Tax=Sabulicella rubraurantiaca TaxID=2811429 RepID=UPI001A9668BA|nr:bacteriohopanetetrol glucosamine biosynthesis glycosyltransferase HpnI [Sabulicella rubraurantiaca]
MTVLAVLFSLLALVGAGQAVAARRALRRLAGSPLPTSPALPASVLKPLHGAEPGLEEGLRASFGQRHEAPFEVLMAVADPADPARPVAEAAIAAGPAPGRLLAGGAVLGSNRKVSQLVHLEAAASHPILVAADADMLCPPEWLTAVSAPLADPSVGLVTCLYRGEARRDTAWARLAALGIDWHFLPNAALGEALGKAQGCYGATVALRQETLERLGGFRDFLDLLADDHALGAAVRRLGLRVVVSPVLPGHAMTETSLAELWRHELRWARTVRLLNPAGYAGLLFTHPLPWALLALALAPGALMAGVLGAALGARLFLATGVDRALGRRLCIRRLTTLPIRDLLSAAIWATAWGTGRVDWQGRRYALSAKGRMTEAGSPRHRGS